VAHKTSPLAIKVAGGITGAWIMTTAGKAILSAVVVVLVALGVWNWKAVEGPASESATVALTGEVALEPVPFKGEAAGVVQFLEPATSRSAVGVPAVDPPPVAAEFALLRIRVLAKETGRPVSGIALMARPVVEQAGTVTRFITGAHAAVGESPVTALDGVASIEIAARTAYWVGLRGGDLAVGEASTTVEALAVGETRELVLEVRAEMDLVFCGRVLDEVSRAPIVGAQFTIRSGAIPEELNRKRSTDSDGRFEVLVQSWNQPTLSVAAAGYSSTWVLPSASHETPKTAFEVLLAHPATLRVRLLETSGRPIAGARLSAMVPRYKLAQPSTSGTSHSIVYADESFSAVFDANGVAELTGLPPRAGMELTAERGRELLRREPTALVLQPGELRELEWRVGAGCRVYGLALEADGRPASGQEIWLQPARMPGPQFLEMYDAGGRRTAKCAADGAFEILDVPPGSWLVGPAGRGGQNREWREDLVASLAQPIEVFPGLLQARVDIELVRGLSIRGRVEAPDGRPIARTMIFCSQVDSAALIVGQSGDDGGFTIGPLVVGDYKLRARPTQVRGAEQFAAAPELTVRSGAIDVVLRMQPGCSIIGRVIDAVSGEPVDAELLVSPLAGQSGVEDSWSLPNATRAKGFEIRGLNAASYSLAARTTDGSVGLLSPIALQSGEQKLGVEIRVERGALLSVSYDGPRPYGSMQVLLNGVPIVAAGMERGSRQTFPVPSGASTARMVQGPPLENFDLELDLKVGETKELRFDGAWK
jgi:hypothetical protein